MRELRNIMERAAILCPSGSPVLPEHLPPLENTSDIAQETDSPKVLSISTSHIPKLEDEERKIIELAIKFHTGNVQAAARDLGISRGTLYRKAEKYGIELTQLKSNDKDE